MINGISLIVASLCLVTLGAMLLPDDFAMPVNDDGNFWDEPDLDS
jgi:hypothetical protein